MNLTIFLFDAIEKKNQQEEIVSTAHRSMNCVLPTILLNEE